MIASIKAWFIREWRSVYGPLAIFADAWASIFDPEAKQVFKRGNEFNPPRGGMSVREARIRGLF